MKEKDIHILIEEQNPEAKRIIWEKVSSQLNLASSQPQKPSSKKKTVKWTVIATVILCAVTLSIVLPLALQGDGVRYCNEGSYVVESLGQTVKEYTAAHGNKLLYVDWYDISDETETKCGRLIKNRDDIIFFEERFVNSETGESLKLSITDNKTKVDKYERFNLYCEDFMVDNIKVSWKNASTRSTIAIFEYNKNVYYLQIDEADATERLAEIIREMLK